MHECIHTYMHACMHAYIHAYIHFQLNTLKEKVSKPKFSQKILGSMILY